MSMGSHVFSWCWFLLVCGWGGSGGGGALFPFMMGVWVVSGFTGLCVL